MAITKGKQKKPPTFHHLPKSRARQLKKSWIEDHEIRRKWKAQKRREGLIAQTSAPDEETSNHAHDETNVGRSPNLQIKDKSSHDGQLRDPRRIANPTPTQKAESSSHSKRAPGHSHNDPGRKGVARRETGQPNMKLRMNDLLEKIKRDFS